MPYAITLQMNVEASSKIQDLYELLADKGISNDQKNLGYPPHITLAVVDDIEQSHAKDVLEKLAQKWRAFPIQLTEIGNFHGIPATIFIHVAKAPLLHTYQSLLCHQIPTQSLNPHYKADQWIPHLTLAKDILDQDALKEATQSVRAVWKPLNATLNDMALIYFRPVQILWQASLR